MTASELLSRLHAVRETPTGWVAMCPAHDDTNPSLSVAEGDDGSILLFCHAGCVTDAVVAKLGLTMADLFPRRQSMLRSLPGGVRIANIYNYVDEHRRPLCQVVRMEPKAFRQRRPDGKGGWIWDVDGVPHVPYRLPELIAAVDAGHTVFITEGEKDVDTLATVGLAATTNRGGAGKWRPEYAKHLLSFGVGSGRRSAC